MERDKKSNYRSDSALGQIYDRIRIEEFHAAYEMSFDTRILSRYQLEEDTLTKASGIKVAYDIAMRRLMGQHEAPVTEFEIWSTFILSKPRVGSDYKLQENTGRDMAALRERFRAECMEAVTGNDQTQGFVSASSMANTEKLDQFVAAMYTVTNNDVRAAMRERSMPNPAGEDGSGGTQMPLISFPWLFHRELARVALGRGGDVRPLQKSVRRNQDENQQGLRGAVGFDGDAQQPLLDAQPQRGGNATERGDGSEDGEAGEDCVRTSSGQVVRRGQMLTLFTDAGEKIHGSQTVDSLSDNFLVADESPGSSGPASPRSERRSDEEYESIEFEEVDGAAYEEEEDALEALAKKLGM